MNVNFITQFCDRKGAGLYFAVYPLTNKFEELGHSVEISNVAFDRAFDKADLDKWSGTLNSFRNPFMSSSQRPIDIMHLHGLWGLHSWHARLMSHKRIAPLVISPHGMLDSWALLQSRHKKRICSLLNENKLLSSAAVVHALNKSEAQAIREFSPNVNIEIIPNGISVPSFEKNYTNSMRRVLFLSRIDKKKGIYELINFWKMNFHRYQNVELHIVGKGDSNFQALLSNVSRLKYHGALYGNDKEEIFQTCDFFILPSFSEGLPMTVLEAWAHGIPTFISKACNLEEETRFGLSGRVEPNLQSLRTCFDQIKNMSDQDILFKGRALRKHVSKKYDWGVIAKSHLNLYRDIKL